MAGKFQTDFFIQHAAIETTISAGGAITISQGYHTVAAASPGVPDDLSTIVLGTGIGDLFGTALPYVILKAKAGDTITLVHDAAPSATEFYLVGQANFTFSGSRLVKLYYVDGIWTDALLINAPSGGFIGATSPTITTPQFTGLETAVGVFKFANINALNIGQTIIVPSRTSKRFIPVSAQIELIAVTGAGTEPSVNLGSNGSWDNLVTTVALTGLGTQYELFPLTLANTTSLDVGSTGISIDIDTAATGFSVYTINVYVTGYYR